MDPDIEATARDRDLFAAIEQLHSLGPPQKVADAYHHAVIDAYWKSKDLPLVVALALAGITYCLTHAQLASDEAQRASFRAAAKGLAYNLASFTWPGWDEPGISPTPDQIALGLHAARFNLRVAHELQKPAEKIRAAHWLLGAHLLAAGRFQDALAEFQQAISLEENEAIGDRLTFEGYILLARLLLNDRAAETSWQALLQTLHARADDEAKNARSQLITARQVFEPAHRP